MPEWVGNGVLVPQRGERGERYLYVEGRRLTLARGGYAVICESCGEPTYVILDEGKCPNCCPEFRYKR